MNLTKIEKPMKEGEGKEYDRVEKSIEKNGMRKTVRAEEVENGWLITIDKEGEMDGEYKYECKKYISKRNPFDEKEDKEDEKDFKTILNSIDTIEY